MNKKIVGIALAILAVTGVAFASSDLIVLSSWYKYAQVQAIPSSLGFPINVYKVMDTDSNVNCYIAGIGGGATISCVKLDDPITIKK